MKAYPIFLVIMSVLALVLYKADKEKARNGKWRIKESTLLSVGFFGGAAGALIAMQLFRHKTRHWYFWAVNVLGLVMQMAVLFYLFIDA